MPGMREELQQSGDISESAICVGRSANMHNDPSAGVRWLDVILRNDWILGLIIIALGPVLTAGQLALLR